MKEVILTGLRTNAEYHLGNYIGGLQPLIKMATEKSGEYQINLFAPDLHSFTTEIDHKTFYKQTTHNLLLFAACGLPYDQDGVCVYRQSRIPAHSELAWILSNFTYFGELSRMTQFKDKTEDLIASQDDSILQTESGENLALESSGPKGKNISAGLFIYPVLMAADILLYDAAWVPVGEDQRQHLEFTRDIAERFNNRFGQVFTVPKPLNEQQRFVNRDEAPRIRSLRDPSKKMSKSISDPAGTIQLSDSADEARKKIMSATTDSVGAIHFNWETQPGVTNLLQILALLTEQPQHDVNAEWEGNERYGDLKTAVADVVVQKLADIQAGMDALDVASFIEKLEADETEMNDVAMKKLAEVQKAIGLRE